MATRPDAGTAAPQRVVAGRYALLERLGAGGMGTVWRARDEVLGREVALKEVLFPPGLPDADRQVLRERTRREARAAAGLHHRAAVTVFDVVEDSGAPFLVMELVQGRTLADAVRDDGPLPPRSAAQVGLALLGALEAAHRQGILHRDVKPSNVLLEQSEGTGSPRVVLTDFGIATSPGDSSITSTGLLLGSPSYIAPERALGQQPGPASDLWSLGATLYTAVEGRAPFDRGEPLATLAAVAHDEPLPPTAAGPLAAVLTGLLARDPRDRLDAASARRMLQEVVRGPAVPAPAPTPAPAEDHRRAQQTSVLPLPVAPADPAASAPAAARTAPSTAPSTARPAPAPAAAAAAVPPAPAGPPAPVRTARPSPAPLRRPERPGRSGGRGPLIAAGVVAALALAGGGAVLLGQQDAGSDPRAAATTPPSAAPPATPPTPSRPASRTPSPTPPARATTAPPADAVPAGWRTYRGGPGWTVAVPPSYAVGTFSGDPQYTDGTTGRTLRVSTTGPGGGKPDPVQDRRDQAASFARSHPDYREISIASVDYRGWPAADWEFTYSGLHVLNRVFVVDGRGYSLFFQTRQSDDWSAARAQFEQIAAAFVPAGG